MDGEMPDYLLAKDLILQVSFLGFETLVLFASHFLYNQLCGLLGC